MVNSKWREQNAKLHMWQDLNKVKKKKKPGRERNRKKKIKIICSGSEACGGRRGGDISSPWG